MMTMMVKSIEVATVAGRLTGKKFSLEQFFYLVYQFFVSFILFYLKNIDIKYDSTNLWSLNVIPNFSYSEILLFFDC